MDQSSFPKQTRADQDRRSDVDQDLPVDQTRKNDVRRRRRRTFKTKQNVARSSGVGDSSNIVNAEMFPQNFGTPSSSFPKQSRADQDSRSDVDQDLPVDQTRKEDDASGDSCGRPTLTLMPSPPKLRRPSCHSFVPEICVARSSGRNQDSVEKEFCKIKTFPLRGDDGCSGSTVADRGQGGSATTGSSGGGGANTASSGGVKKIAATIFCFLFLLIIITISGANSAQLCDRCAHQSNASYFSTPSAYSSGACGYGPLAIGFNHGHLASVAPSLYKNGAACGACFQIRCKNLALCSSKGARVTVTGSNSNNRTGFVLSRRALKALAKQGSESEIYKHKILDLEYKWVPCAYKSQNLTLRVEESSQYPNYLAVQILNQGGQTEIGAIDVLGGNNVGSGFMSRKHGAVWDTKLDRAGPLVIRFIVRDTFSSQRILTEQPIPANWKPGMSYDTGVQFTAIAREICDVCDNGKWREM